MSCELREDVFFDGEGGDFKFIEDGSIKITLEMECSLYDKVLGIAVLGRALGKQLAGSGDLPFVMLRGVPLKVLGVDNIGPFVGYLLGIASRVTNIRRLHHDK